MIAAEIFPRNITKMLRIFRTFSLTVRTLRNVERSDFPKVHKDPQSSYYYSSSANRCGEKGTPCKYNASQLYFLRHLNITMKRRYFYGSFSSNIAALLRRFPKRRGIIFVKRTVRTSINEYISSMIDREGGSTIDAATKLQSCMAWSVRRATGPAERSPRCRWGNDRIIF